MLLKSFAFALCISVCFESSLTQYEKLAAKWEPDIVQLEKRDQSEVAGPNDILFLGSSTIRRWEDIAKDMAPWPAVNRGYGGAKYSDLAIYIKRLIAAHHPKAIVVFVGNDITGSEVDKTPEEIVALVDHITTTIHEKIPNTDIFFVGITPTPIRWQVWPETSAANLAISKYCDLKTTTHFIATAKEYLNEQGVPREELFVKDRLHQNTDGYAIWSKIIKRELESVFANKPK
jgi:lysophospholipase L1-like esterase